MTATVPTIFVEEWVPYRHLVEATLRIKPLPEVRVRGYGEWASDRSRTMRHQHVRGLCG